MPVRRRRRTLARMLGTALTAAVLAGVAVPSYADTASRLRQERKHAAALDAQAKRQAAAVALADARLAALDTQANAALEQLDVARTAATRAQDRAAAAAAVVVAAQAREQAAVARTDAARERLASLAGDAYRTLAGGGPLATTLSLLDTGNPQTFLDGLTMLGHVGDSRAEAVEELTVAQGAQRLARKEAADAATAATSAAAAAAAARDDAAAHKRVVDGLVAQQHQVLVARQHLLAATRHAAAVSHARAAELARELAAARARAAAIRRAAALAAARARAAGVVPRCTGGSVAGYPNGQLPVAALCPLWGAPGDMLRADAASAFNRMSRAYAGAFGEPLCVEASYRPYQRQVELYASMPAGYAAVPGTSNHGWGLAVDLCGGIQVDGSAQHQWLLDHAAAFDWFHPAWALPGAAGPHEPWHWEYAG